MKIRKAGISIIGAAALTLGLACTAPPAPAQTEMSLPTETPRPAATPWPTPTSAPTPTPTLTAPTPTTERDEIMATIEANMPTARPPTPWPTPRYPTPTPKECEEIKRDVRWARQAGTSDRQMYEDLMSDRMIESHKYAILFHAGLCGVRLNAVPRPQHVGLEVFN